MSMGGQFLERREAAGSPIRVGFGEVDVSARPAWSDVYPGQVMESISLRAAGEQMHRFISELYPICRSITGDGFRETLPPGSQAHTA